MNLFSLQLLCHDLALNPNQSFDYSFSLMKHKRRCCKNEYCNTSLFIPNRSLDRYGAIRYKKDNFLPSFIFLLASCFSFVLDVARYAFELTTNHLLNNLMKSVQNLMTDWGLLGKSTTD